MKVLSKGNKQKYSLKRLSHSFIYAFQGIIQCFKTEQNILIHFIMAVLVIILGFVLNVSSTEFLILILVIGLVISLEMVNTSIEYTIDMTMPQIHPLAKSAKDIAGGAVLFSAITAIVVGIVIFLPKIMELL